MIKLEKDLIEKIRLKRLEAKLTMSSEEVSMKFKLESQMLEKHQIENLLRDNRLLKSFNKDQISSQMSAPNTYLRAKIDNIRHLEKAMTFKTDVLLDLMIMTCKTTEVEATIRKENQFKKLEMVVNK